MQFVIPMRLLRKIVVFVESAPFVVVSHSGDTKEAFVELAIFAILVVVGEANNATAWVDELVFDASIAKAFGGVKKDNGVIPAEFGGLFI